jgi:ABC-type antimicrobial peptide transport system permease subunit
MVPMLTMQPKMVALLATIFGSLALLLAMVGLYGVTTYAVAQRKGEIGIRIALGARRPAVIWLMLRDVVMLLAVGMLLGLGASLAAGRLIHSLLYGVQANAPAQPEAAARSRPAPFRRPSASSTGRSSSG